MNWCICCFFTHIFTGILVFKGLTARRLYKSFGVKGLILKSCMMYGVDLGKWAPMFRRIEVYSSTGSSGAKTTVLLDC
jgi:hypothetical protein